MHDLDSSVVDWIIDHPRLQATFDRLGIDCSCGGKSLGYACEERGLDPAVVLDELRGVLQAEREGGETL